MIKKFINVLKYIWKNRTRLIIPFILGELIYWCPVIILGIVSIVKSNYITFFAFWGVYVGILPAMPIQIALTFIIYFLFDRKNKKNIRDEANKIIQDIK